MIALLQSSPNASSVAIPSWVLGLAGTAFMLLLGIIGYLLTFLLTTFKEVIGKLEKSIKEFVATFQAFKDEAPKEYVTHPFLELVRQELKSDVTNGHRRIKEATDRFTQELADHKRDCPVRALRAMDGG